MAEQKKSILYSCKSNNHTTRKLFISLRRHKDVYSIKALLQKGLVDMDARDSKGRTLLLLASSNRRKKIVDLLIKAGANVHDKCIANECTLLHYASRHGWTKIVRSLVHQVPALDAMDIRGETPLHVAARSGHLKIVKCLVENGADINRKNFLGFTSLISAAQYQKKGVFDLLSNSGAIVNSNVRLLLYYFSRNSWAESVQSLVKRVPDLNERYVMGETALEATSSRGHLEVVKFLMKEGTDTHKENEMIMQEALYHASYMGHLKVVKWLVEKGTDMKGVPDLNARHKSGNTALHLALSTGHLEVVKWLVEKRADINTKGFLGRTPLHLSSIKGHVEVVKWLVKNGVPDINAKDKNGDTALHLASDIAHLEIIKCLVEEGADINSRNCNGETPLHAASKNGDLEVVKWLVTKEADINARCKHENTALCMASSEGHLDVVKWLLDNGADINAKNWIDETPLLCAVFHKHKDVFDLLMYSGANLVPSWAILQLASGYGWVDIVHILIKKGCDPDANSNYGSTSTALEYACNSQQLDTARVLLQAGASLDSAIGYLSLNSVVAEKNTEFIKLFIENGACIKPADYEAIVKSSSLTVLQNTKLCCQAILNKFNNHDLPELYKVLASESLPRIENMKIACGSEVAQAVERTVEFEIQTNGHCNIIEVCPMTLRVFSVRSVLEYIKKTSQLKKRLKLPAAFCK